MDDTPREDRNRLATIGERGPTKESAPEPCAGQERANASADAPPSASPQGDPPEPRRTLPLEAEPVDSERAGAAPEAAVAVVVAPEIAARPLLATQKADLQQTAATQSASDSTRAEQAAPPSSPVRPAVAGETDGLGAQSPIHDGEAIADNIGQAIQQQAGEAPAADARPREAGEINARLPDDLGEMNRSFGQLAQHYMADPLGAFQAQTTLATQFVNLWTSAMQRFLGSTPAPLAAPDRADKRFSDAEWRDNPFFDFIKQAYVLTSRWADDLVNRADELEPHDRDKARFYLRQVSAALSPSNFVATNPELLRTTLAEGGENLVRGLKMLAEDIQAGHGKLRIRQSDARAFELGGNLAATPGKVIFRNPLIELIQYEPTTPDVYERPLLIVPPWINKYYVLDLNPEKSFIRWAVAQGLTVFVISWVNPDERHADKDFDSYMHEGILTALGAIEQATDEREVAAIGYCVGGTLLAATLAYMAAVGDRRIESVTFFASLVDFTDAGDLKVFVDAAQLKAVEERMAKQGYLEGSHMANAFNMLRPNDLIWSYYVNNYLKGKEPMPFDLLVWNSDSTRMPAANHNFYLRHCYLQNDLSNGRMVLSGRTLDLEKVTIPIYELAAREDHIAPTRGVFKGAKCFGGPVRFVLAGSGHIAGVVNPADKPKYQFWTGGRRRANLRLGSPRPRKRSAPGGPTGPDGSSPRRRRRSPPASPATAS